MISALKGKVESLSPTLLELDVNGVVYAIGISLHCYNEIKESAGESSADCVKIHTTQIIREDAHLLFGFCSLTEKRTFERLIKISGVGPKVAMAILSTYTPTGFGRIIESKEVSALQRVPGIGAKNAGKIMVDLAGFFKELMEGAESKVSNVSDSKKEAKLALSSLGFKATDIDKALKNLESSDTAELVKLALKALQRL